VTNPTDLPEDTLARRSRYTAVVTLFGALLTLSALVYASLELIDLTQQIDAKRAEMQRLQHEAQIGQRTIDALEARIDDLERTETGVLEFLAQVTRGEQIEILDPTVDWSRIKAELIEMPASTRKQALLIALLYAWKEIPFELGGRTLGGGFDSPRFLQRVLSDVGVKFDTSPGERLSDAMMSQLSGTTSPRPGDLVFFRGQVGSFGFILLSTGDDQAPRVGVGTLQEIAPLQVISLSNINTPEFPRIGYFRVDYPGD